MVFLKKPFLTWAFSLFFDYPDEWNKKVFWLALRFDLHSESKPYIEPDRAGAPYLLNWSQHQSKLISDKDFQLGLLSVYISVRDNRRRYVLFSVRNTWLGGICDYYWQAWFILHLFFGYFVQLFCNFCVSCLNYYLCSLKTTYCVVCAFL